MKANKQMDDLHKKVIKKYHTLASLCGLADYEKEAILQRYGVESSVDMQTHDLIDVCGELQRRHDNKTGASAQAETMDKLRKRTIKAVCSYIDLKGINTTGKVSYAKKMAQRAAKREDFNRCTAAELRAVIGYFNKESETIDYLKKLPDYSAAGCIYSKNIGQA